MVDPVVGIVFIVVFPVHGLSSRKAIRAAMLVGRNVDQFEIEEQNCCDPSVDGGIRLDVWVAKHTTDEYSIHLHNQMLDANDV